MIGIYIIIIFIIPLFQMIYTLKCYSLFKFKLNRKCIHHINNKHSNILNDNKNSEMLLESINDISYQSFSNDYEYIDSGSYKRLERFGNMIVERSCPSAFYQRTSSINEWNDKNRLIYTGLSGKIGEWSTTNVNDNWTVAFNDVNIKFSLTPSDYGQLGVFPEQYSNWRWLKDKIESYSNKSGKITKVLNGFAYTGGSTMACMHTNVEVTHLDASKSFINWTKRNINLTYPSSNSTRFIIDDCMTFIDREIKREKKYDGLIFDPPAFGRAEKGKIWKIDRDFPILIDKISLLLSDNPCFVLLTCHDEKFTESDLIQLLRKSLTSITIKGKFECGQLTLKSKNYKYSNPLKLGTYARWSSN